MSCDDFHMLCKVWIKCLQHVELTCMTSPVALATVSLETLNQDIPVVPCLINSNITASTQEVRSTSDFSNIRNYHDSHESNLMFYSSLYAVL